MSNINAPSGFTPVKNAVGGTPRPNNGGDYAIAGGLASNIFTGSLVKPTGTGMNIDVVAAGANPSIGTFAGCNFVDSNGNTNFRPMWTSGQAILGGTVVEATVYDDPDLLFDGMVSGVNGLAATNIGNTANVLIGVGNALTGRSADEVDGSTLSAVSTAQQLQIVSLRNQPGNSYGEYARALLQIFLHYKRALVTPY